MSRDRETSVTKRLNIRIFRIFPPSSEDDEIECELVSTPLPNNGDVKQPITSTFPVAGSHTYCALSYTWEPKLPLRTIHVNGESIKIGRNLWSLMSELRRRQEDRWLWADAISIDQQNLGDKKLQVAALGQTFKSSLETLIWLGDSTNSSELAYDFLECKPPRDPEGTHEEAGRFWQSRNYHRESPEFRSLCLAFAALARREYWERRWTIQERVLASQSPAGPWIYCGRRKCPLSDIKAGWEFILRQFLTPISDVSKLDSHPLREDVRVIQRLLSNISTGKLSGQSHSLDMVLFTYREAACLEPLDRIYALLALCSDVGSLMPDYSRNIFDVFWDLAGFSEGVNNSHNLGQRTRLTAALLANFGSLPEFMGKLLVNALQDRKILAYNLDDNDKICRPIVGLGTPLGPRGWIGDPAVASYCPPYLHYHHETPTSLWVPPWVRQMDMLMHLMWRTGPQDTVFILQKVLMEPKTQQVWNISGLAVDNNLYNSVTTADLSVGSVFKNFAFVETVAEHDPTNHSIRYDRVIRLDKLALLGLSLCDLYNMGHPLQTMFGPYVGAPMDSEGATPGAFLKPIKQFMYHFEQCDDGVA